MSNFQVRKRNSILIFIILLHSFFIGTILIGNNDNRLGFPSLFTPQVMSAPNAQLILLNLNNIGNRSYLSSLTKYDGNNTIIAILDTGIDPSHPDLDDLDDNNDTNDPKIIGGVSFVEGEPLYLGDIYGQGTFVAGIIAGTGNVSNEYIGIAPQAKLLNVKVLSSYKINDTFYTKPSWIISGIEWSINHGADIIVMAWSIPGLPNDEINLAISKAVKKGLIVITASGDDGPEFSSIGSPGMGPEGITVGIYDNLTNNVAEISSRGPTFDFRVGIDILASGINISSTRAKNSSFGSIIDENYTSVNSSTASAAYVAGVTAIYLQAFEFLNPWALEISLMSTAIDLKLNPNIQGAGLLNETAAFNYLNQTLNFPLNSNRTYSPSLPYAGFIGTENSSLFFKDFSSNCSFGDYGEAIILTEYTNSTDFNASHLIGERFAVQYNNGNITWFSDFKVLREMHYVSLGIYDRIVSILSDDKLLIIILIESWEYANISGSTPPYWTYGNLTSFRIKLIFENMGNEVITNLSLFSWWKVDLFLNESDNYDKDDQGGYNGADNLFYVWDTDNKTSNVTYIGFKSNSSAIRMWYEVNSSENTYNFVEDDNIKNGSSSFGPGDVGFAMKWQLLNKLEYKQKTQFMGAIGIGKSYEDLKNQTSWIITNVTEFNNITDICIVPINNTLTRMLNENEVLHSSICLINVGSTTIDYGIVVFEANSTNEGVKEIFYLSANFTPYFFNNSISVLWTPTYGGFFNVSWIGINATVSELDQIKQNLDYNDTRYDFQLADNIFQRNILKINSTYVNDFTPLLFSNISLPFFPFMMNFSGDFAIFNLTILSSKAFSNLTHDMKGNITDWIDIEYQEIDSYFGTNFVSITLNTSFLTLPGYYQGNITINLNTTQYLINASFDIKFPRGRILFDLSHISITSIEFWPKRLNSIHSAYFNFYQNVTNYDLKIDELPISELTYEILEFYDCLIIADPTKNFSNSEIGAVQNYVNNGGSLFLWVEPPNECANASINLLLNGTFDIEMRDTIYPNNSIVCNHSVPDELFSENISSIEMVSPVNLSISESPTNANNLTDYITYWHDENKGKIIVLGDSQIFNNDYLYLGNNSQFAINCLNWLINETLKVSYFNVTPDIIHLGEIVCITINLTAPNGTGIAAYIAIAAFVFPNGSVFYMPMFYIREGYHTTFLLSGFVNLTGNFTIYIYLDHVSGVMVYYNSSFNITSPLPAEPTPSFLVPIIPDYNFWLLIIWLILGCIITIWAISAIKLKRKIKIIKVKEGK